MNLCFDCQRVLGCVMRKDISFLEIRYPLELEVIRCKDNLPVVISSEEDEQEKSDD